MTDSGQLLSALVLVGQPMFSRGPSSPLPQSIDITQSQQQPPPPYKLLRLAAFGPSLHPTAVHYSFRIYVVMDTDDALQARTYHDDDDDNDNDNSDCYIGYFEVVSHGE